MIILKTKDLRKEFDKGETKVCALANRMIRIEDGRIVEGREEDD